MAGDDIILCPANEVPLDGAKGFTPPTVPEAMFVVRTEDGLFGYRNVCPHQDTPLDWAPNVFLCPNKAFIQCSTHAAQFEIDTGECVTGPCLGEFLTPAPIVERDGDIVLLAAQASN